MKDILDLLKKDIGLSFNCHHIGSIQSFDGATQTATVTISYKRTYFDPLPNGEYKRRLEDFPILAECPVVQITGGDGGLSVPIQAGDECLLLFNDRDIDNWYSGSASSEVATNRLHSISDAIALVGVRSKGKAVADYSDSRVVLYKGENKISIGEDDVKIELPSNVILTLTKAGKFSVVNASGELLTALNTILTTATAAGFPLVVDPTALATFQSFKA